MVYVIVMMDITGIVDMANGQVDCVAGQKIGRASCRERV